MGPWKERGGGHSAWRRGNAQGDTHKDQVTGHDGNETDERPHAPSLRVAVLEPDQANEAV